MSTSQLLMQIQSEASAKDDMQDLYDEQKVDKDKEQAYENIKSLSAVPNALLEVHLTKKLMNLADKKLVQPLFQKTRKFIKSKNNDLTGEEGELNEDELKDISLDDLTGDTMGYIGNALSKGSKSAFNAIKKYGKKTFNNLNENVEELEPEGVNYHNEEISDNVVRQYENNIEMQDFANLPTEPETIENASRSVMDRPPNISLQIEKIEPEELQQTGIQGEIQNEDPEEILGEPIVGLGDLADLLPIF